MDAVIGRDAVEELEIRPEEGAAEEAWDRGIQFRTLEPPDEVDVGIVLLADEDDAWFWGISKWLVSDVGLSLGWVEGRTKVDGMSG